MTQACSDPGCAQGSDSSPRLSAAGLLGRGKFLETLRRCGTDRSVFERYGLDSVESVLVAALAYGESREAPRPSWTEAFSTAEPELEIARFARADWYAEIGICLERLSRAMHASLAPDHPAIAGSRRRNWHRLANSRLPEKALAVEAGLGFIGKNSLLIVDRGIEPIGPSVVLGLLLMPVSVENARRAMIGSAEGAFADPDLPYVPEESDCAAGGAIPTGRGKAGFTCGACQSCFDACPTKAIRPEGGIRRELCLQHWAAVPGKLPEIVEANWGKRLYGCDLCMEACPWFRDASLDSLPSQGVLGPSLPAGFFLASTDNEIRLRLYGTALGLGWMRPDAFRRNAVRACETLRREGGKVPSHP